MATQGAVISAGAGSGPR